MSTVLTGDENSNQPHTIGSSGRQTGLFIREAFADQDTNVSSDDDDRTPLSVTFPTQSTLTIRGTPMVGECSNGMASEAVPSPVVSQHNKYYLLYL